MQKPVRMCGYRLSNNNSNNIPNQRHRYSQWCRKNNALPSNFLSNHFASYHQLFLLQVVPKPYKSVTNKLS